MRMIAFRLLRRFSSFHLFSMRSRVNFLSMLFRVDLFSMRSQLSTQIKHIAGQKTLPDIHIQRKDSIDMHGMLLNKSPHNCKI